MDRKWLTMEFFFHECTTKMLLVQNDSYRKISLYIFSLISPDIQIGTKMGQQKIGFLAHFLGTHANANFDKWVLCPSLGCGWLVWAGFSPAKSLRAKKSKQECKKSSFDALRPYWKFNLKDPWRGNKTFGSFNTYDRHDNQCTASMSSN